MPKWSKGNECARLDLRTNIFNISVLKECLCVLSTACTIRPEPICCVSNLHCIHGSAYPIFRFNPIFIFGSHRLSFKSIDQAKCDK